MKIAHVTSTFPPYEGGMGNVCYNQAKQLSDFGHEVVVFVPANNYKKFVFKNESFKLKYIKPLFSFGNASFLPQLTRELKGFDIIHLHYPFYGGDIFVRKASKKYNIPYVLTYHLDIFFKDVLKKIIIKIYNLLFQYSIFKDSNKILISSKEFFESSQIKNIVIRNKICYIPCGIDLQNIDKGKNIPNLRSKYNIKKDIPLIIFIGALDKAHYYKRLDILIEALSVLQKGFHLFVVGDGDLKENYVSLVNKCKLNNVITFIGKLGNKNIFSYLDQVDFLVLPSDNESFGIILIEAMACSKPVIVSNLPGVRPIVSHMTNGLLFKKGSKKDLIKQIKILIDNKELVSKLGVEGKKIVESRYDWRIISKKLQEIYFLNTKTKK